MISRLLDTIADVEPSRRPCHPPKGGRVFYGKDNRVRILIADHQPAVRSALRLLLEERLEPDVVGEAVDNHELRAQLARLRPDILLLDWDLPGWSTAGLFEAFGGLDRQPKVIVLGVQPEAAQEALAAGADAFVSKSDPPKRLLTAIRALAAEGQRE